MNIHHRHGLLFLIAMCSSLAVTPALDAVAAPKPTLQITTSELTAADLEHAYSLQLHAETNQTGSISWTLANGTLPAGIQLSSAGKLTGTPVTVGSYPLTLKATLGKLTDSLVCTLAVTSNTEYPSGTLIKQEGDPTVWLLEDQQLYGFRTPTEFLSHGFNWDGVVEVTTPELAIYQQGAVYTIQSGTLIKDPNSPEVYLVQDTVIHPFSAAAIFLNLGYQWEAIYTTVPQEITYYTIGSLMQSASTHFPYTKIKVNSNPTVYLLKPDNTGKLYRYPMATPGVFLSHGWRWPEIITVSPTEFNLYPEAALLFYRDGSLIKPEGGTTIYVMEYGKKRLIASADYFEAMRYHWSMIITAPAAEVTAIPTGEPIVPDQNKLDLLEARREAERTAFASWESSGTVSTPVGSFAYKLVKATRGGTEIQTVSATKSECANNCPAQSLDAYVAQSSGFAGMHGSYFCPPDYAYCSSSRYYYDTPLYDSLTNRWINWANRDWNDRGAITVSGSTITSHWAGKWAAQPDGSFNVWHDTSVPETGLDAAIFNFPLLLHNGTIVANTGNTDSKQQQKAARGAFGFDSQYLYLATFSNASVIDAAYAMQALGATSALNLDGGGSSALYYQGHYLTGPGRLLPNAIVLKQK